jgi:pyruvate, water dikinase
MTDRRSGVGPLIAALAATLALIGCGEPGLLVAFEGPQAFLLVVDRGDAGVEQLTCPAEPVEGASLDCVEGGARIALPDDVERVTVKARGFAFVSQEVEPSELEQVGGELRLELEAAALLDFERTDDFATGFGADGLEDWRSLAYVVDTELGTAEVVKFYIDLAARRVWLQDTNAHPLHYDFAREVLGVTGTATDFYRNTYRGEDRQAMAGTLVRYPAVQAASEALGDAIDAPIAVTFFPSDDLSPALALRAHQLIEERLGFAPLTGGADRVVYLPAGSQQEADLAGQRRLFDARAALWAKRTELSAGDGLQILNPGLAYGTLRLLSPEELAATVVSYTDILVLTRLPNELPIVGGTITEESQTPLAHVNVAAIARGTPNLAWPGASEDEQVAALLGELVRFEVTADAFTLEATTLAEAQEFWDSRVPEPVIPEYDLETRGLPGFDELGHADSDRVGAKAANLAELHGLLPDVSPDGFGVPFAWYDDFMQTTFVDDALCDEAEADCVDEGRSEAVCGQARAICGEFVEPESLDDYRRRVSALEAFAGDSLLREALLDGLRHHVRNVPVDEVFADQLNARVLEVFGTDKVRLRSSTNAEDLDDFSGAGLYTSVSAYGAGPDKLASDQIRKVWASVFSWRAWEERSFWGIDHDAVFMGVAVSRAYPDEEANGVLLTQNIADPTVAGLYVNVQLGEVPVTNPEGGEVPEVFSIIPGAEPGTLQVARSAWSSLSPGAPILTEGEIEQLYDAATAVQEHYAPLYGQSPYSMTLDLEFKFVGAERALVIKQVRPFVAF